MDDRLNATPLVRLADACGIEPGYHDVQGAWHETADATRRLLLAAMGMAAADDQQAVATLATLEAERAGATLEPVYVLRRAQVAAGIDLPGELPANALTWKVHEEWGRTHGGSLADRRVALPDALGEGYHRLSLLHGETVIAESALIVVPEACYLPPEIEGGGRLWGAMVQLYSLTSGRNAGIGDFTDLRACVEACAKQGAALVGVSPLHALSAFDNPSASPYSPSSRLFLNENHLDVETVAEFAALERESPELVADYRREAQALREAKFVEHARVFALKRRVLEALHARFATEGDPAREREFDSFRRRQGEPLRRFALHVALEEYHAAQGNGGGWRNWPQDHRHPALPTVQAFEREHAGRIAFHEYVQWQADAQLARVSARCAELEMPVGLYADLAVSVASGGSEAWFNQSVYAQGAYVGAPPDDFNREGQDWGLPPFIPGQLRREAYAPFVATLRANMAHAGALRIDHAMGLARLYWVPAGHPASQGAYVRYRLDELLGVVALESHRRRCLVIGEDLGTVPPELFERLQAANVLSTRLMLFERDGDGRFRSPGVQPRKAAIAWSTHDLPTIAGWWDQQVDGQRRELARALSDPKLLRDGAELPAKVPAAVLAAVHRHLARAPSALALVQMEDALGLAGQPNVPGADANHPNWRRKYPVAVEALEADARFRANTRALSGERGRGRATGTRQTAARIPRATYRLQLHKDFTFCDATRLVPYLAALGISHLYCSPYLLARAGSQHGYDIVAHDQINPEIGTRADLDRLAAALRAHGMAQMADVVPNHMGVMGADNAWWMDVLESGPASAYAGYFDIEWQPPAPHLAGRVLLPLLGDHYGKELTKGAFALKFEPASGAFAVHVGGHRLPIDPRDYPTILAHAEEPELKLTRIAAEAAALPERSDLAPEAVARRQSGIRAVQAALANLARDRKAGAAIEQAVAAFAGTAGDAASFDRLHALMEGQAWRAAFWRVAADEINYRRFFDINGLAALRMENEEVFEATHRLVLQLVREGVVEALRIDHPDGLFDPRRYFERLQLACAPRSAPAGTDGAVRPTYVVVEKIVAPYENLPRDWPVHGTTGYRFANVVNGLFVDAGARVPMTRAYEAFTGRRQSFLEVARDSRRLVLRTALSGELFTLAHELARIARADRDTQDYTAGALRQALAEVIACFPVYRTYITEAPGDEDRRFIRWAVRLACEGARAADASIYEFIERLLLVEAYPAGDPRQGPALRFARRFQQLSAPVMAKGVEDTAFYRYNRLLSLNDVGSDPEEFGTTLTRFHRASANRARLWPHTVLATSTHDNKRSEDVRARLDVLTEDPAAWRHLLGRWRRMNERHRREVDGAMAPSRNDEYLLYQTLIGSFPLGTVQGSSLGDYRARIAAYLEKALREAKAHTSWANVNAGYEGAMQAFAAALLAEGADNAFLADFRQALAPIQWAGLLNSLSLTAVKLASPGVPDIYQGNETWDFSLVDPDNRRPVDFEQRRAMLSRVESLDGAKAEGLAGLLSNLEDGHAKLFVIARLLRLRAKNEALFRLAGYSPLRVLGERSEHVIAFARRHQGQTLVVIAPRFFVKLGLKPGETPCGALWGDTRVDLAMVTRDAQLFDAFTHREVHRTGTELPLATALSAFPVSVLLATPTKPGTDHLATWQ